MRQFGKILFDLDFGLTKLDIDSIKYSNSLIEYPIPDIVSCDWKEILEKPYTNSSKQTYKEILYVQDQAVSHRSKSDINNILNIDKDPNFGIYKLLEERNLKFPYNYFHMFYDITKPVLLNTKYIFNRARPKTVGHLYGIHIDIIETETHHTPSYPSGHTFYTSLASEILKELYPELKYELNEQVENTANARIRQGVHYQSDNDASLILSKYMFKNLHPILKKEPQWTEFMKY